MTTFFEVYRRHDGEIDGSPQVGEIDVRLVLDLQPFLLLLHLVALIAVLVVIVIVIFIVTAFP